MSMLNTVRINSLSDGACDGAKVGFRMTLADGTHHDVHLSVGDTPKFLAFILEQLQQVALPVPPSAPKSITVKPIPARAIAWLPGRTPTERLIALDLGLFQLVFALPPDHQTP